MKAGFQRIFFPQAWMVSNGRFSLRFKIIAAGALLLVLVASIDFSGWSLIQQALPEDSRDRILFLLFGSAAFGVLALTAVVIRILQPVRDLARAAQSFEKGDFKARTHLFAKDEVGQLARTFNQMADHLSQKEAGYSNLVGRVIKAQEEERSRVARELHDRTGQSLATLIFGLKELETQCKGCLVGKMNVESFKALVSQTLEEVHQMAVAMHPRVLDELGLFTAIRRQRDVLQRRFKIWLDFQTIGFQEDERLPHEIETTLYRIFQEATVNAIRHGKAKSVNLLIQRNPEGVLMIIEDDGSGFDASSWREDEIQGQHLGLLTMEERANLVGGSFEVESGNGRKGAALYIRLPVFYESTGKP